MNNPSHDLQHWEKWTEQIIERISYSAQSAAWIRNWLLPFFCLIQKGEQAKFATDQHWQVTSYTHLRVNLPKYISKFSKQFPEDTRYATLLFKLNVETANESRTKRTSSRTTSESTG